MIGFQAQAEKCFFYFMMFLASISFYTIFGQFMVYVTPSQQIAQASPCPVAATYARSMERTRYMSGALPAQLSIHALLLCSSFLYVFG
jgi:hypothetical protein